jgi:hypothetical protein
LITEKTANKVLSKLEGWVLEDSDSGSSDPDPFSESNKIVTLAEVDDFWRTAFSKARLYVRNNPDVLRSDLINDFVECVICWTASDLWRKYNHKVTSPGDEGVTTDNRGKDLYFDGKAILDNLRLSRLQGLS